MTVANEEDDSDSAAEDDDGCGAEEAHMCDPISVANAVFTTLRTTCPAMLAARHTLTLCNAWRFIPLSLNPKPPRCSASRQSMRQCQAVQGDKAKVPEAR